MFKKLSSAFALVLLSATFTLTLLPGDAEARRLGGGKSFGMQRQATPPTAPKSAPQSAAAPTAAGAATAAAAPKRSWLGPVAGLAAGLGLAALASHLGFGEELASFMLMALIALVVLFILRRVMARRRPDQAPLAYAGGRPDQPVTKPFEYAGGRRQAVSAGAATEASASIPADFDRAGFERQAKLNFIRLQAANDRGDLDDLREFTTPEFFAEIKMQFDERQRVPQQTDVVTLDADVIEAVTEASRHVVSVRFHGLLREEAAADGSATATPFDEIWHLVKPTDGGRGWAVAGIQQTH